MTSADRAPSPHVAGHVDAEPRPDGNATDLRYLEQSCAALVSIMAACGTAAARSERHDVRAVASRARAVQAQQLRATSDVLRAWGQPDPTRHAPTEGDALVGLVGQLLDRTFVERLSAHAYASIAAARAELVTGASPAARLLAEGAIHAEDRQLAALERLALVASVVPERGRGNGPWSGGREQLGSDHLPGQARRVATDPRPPA